MKDLGNGFKKDNLEAKVRFDLIPVEVFERVAVQFTGGANKYGVNNWRKANSQEAEHGFLEAAYRHFVKIVGDVEDGEDHIAASITNLMMYAWHINHKNEIQKRK